MRLSVCLCVCLLSEALQIIIMISLALLLCVTPLSFMLFIMGASQITCNNTMLTAAI